MQFWVATGFLICGLLVLIGGVYSCVAIRHYEGSLLLDDPRVEFLLSTYPVYPPDAEPNGLDTHGIVVKGKTSLSYNIFDSRIMELPYTTYSGYSWIPFIMGLGYIALGIQMYRKKEIVLRD